MLSSRIAEIVKHDIDPDFLRSLSVATGWEYEHCFDDIAENEDLSDPLKSEEFSKRRSNLAVKAMIFAAKKHGIPFDFKRIECNGQEKLLLKIGRVILIQEPILTLADHPRAADYKVELANASGLIRQLELELGDQPQRIYDWSGCVLAVLLHAPAGPRFQRSHRSLGALMLAVPDAHYANWVMRLDLRRIAMFGYPTGDHEAKPVQEDRVIVTPKNRNVATGTEE